MKATGRVMHAYTDSSQSAGEFVTGVKSYNNGVNVTDGGRFVPTLFHQLQAKGWKVGTATSVPFDHVSPAAMYAHDVHRDDFQDLARDMLGLRGIGQETGKDPAHPGLDVVLGAGYGQTNYDDSMIGQGKNAAKGQNRYIADKDKAAINVENGGKYVVVQTAANVNGGKSLAPRPSGLRGAATACLDFTVATCRTCRIARPTATTTRPTASGEPRRHIPRPTAMRTRPWPT